jgi:hypothetical protein
MLQHSRKEFDDHFHNKELKKAFRKNTYTDELKPW